MRVKNIFSLIKIEILSFKHVKRKDIICLFAMFFLGIIMIIFRLEKYYLLLIKASKKGIANDAITIKFGFSNLISMNICFFN